MKLVSSSNDLYEDYRSRMRKIADVKNALAVLQWDQETYLPVKGASFRGQQMATLSELAHGFSTKKRLGELLQELISRNDLSPNQQKNLELSWQDYSRQKKFSGKFVRALSESISQSFHAWLEARRENSFAFFEKKLNGLLELKKQEADRIGYTGHPYDALVDEYEKGCTVSLLDKTFNEIRQPLKALLGLVMGAGQVDDSFLQQYYP